MLQMLIVTFQCNNESPDSISALLVNLRHRDFFIKIQVVTYPLDKWNRAIPL